MPGVRFDNFKQRPHFFFLALQELYELAIVKKKATGDIEDRVGHIGFAKHFGYFII
jgi:hypothetical protein